MCVLCLGGTQILPGFHVLGVILHSCLRKKPSIWQFPLLKSPHPPFGLCQLPHCHDDCQLSQRHSTRPSGAPGALGRGGRDGPSGSIFSLLPAPHSQSSHCDGTTGCEKCSHFKKGERKCRTDSLFPDPELQVSSPCELQRGSWCSRGPRLRWAGSKASGRFVSSRDLALRFATNDYSS